MTDEKPPEKPQAQPPASKPEAIAAKPAAAAVEKAPEIPSEPGVVGQLLTKRGIVSKRLPDSTGVETIELDGAKLQEATKLLRDSELKLNFLVAVSGVDSPDTFDSVYHLRSFYNQNKVVLKVRVPKTSISEGQLPAVPSLANFWDTANWHERESYDLVGIQYVGHPYLRRILNPWDWEGHPLRRDYKQLVDALNDKNPESFR